MPLPANNRARQALDGLVNPETSGRQGDEWGQSETLMETRQETETMQSGRAGEINDDCLTFIKASSFPSDRHTDDGWRSASRGAHP
jgi:hypothetical protein